jgi:hypothetical protein
MRGGTSWLLIPAIGLMDTSMRGYRCYFLNGADHICGVEQFMSPDDGAALERGRRLFARRRDVYSGYEVWQEARRLWKSPREKVNAHRSA